MTFTTSTIRRDENESYQHALAVAEERRDRFGEATEEELKMANETRACWFKNTPAGLWRDGKFHQWSTDFEELRQGVGQFPCAIIEDNEFLRMHVVQVTFVSFAAEKPN